jgi:hypothetical protein
MPDDRVQFAAKTKRVGDALVIELPQKELARLGIGEDEPVIVYLQKYMTHVSPHLKKRQ